MRPSPLPLSARSQPRTVHPVVDAIVNVSLASAFIRTKLDEACAPMGLTGPQYHVLRILMHAPQRGFSRNEVLNSLVEKSVDLTRSINHLIELKLVQRETDKSDRRVALHTITKGGQEVLAIIDNQLRALHTRIAERLGEGDLRLLSELCSRFTNVETESTEAQ